MIVVHTKVAVVNLSLGLEEKEMKVEDKRRWGWLRQTDKRGCA